MRKILLPDKFYRPQLNPIAIGLLKFKDAKHWYNCLYRYILFAKSLTGSIKTTEVTLRVWLQYLGLIFFVWILFTGCNNDSLLKKYQALHIQDSTIIMQTQQDDSAIRSYVNSFNKIQETLEQIKSREHVITLNGENKTSYNPIVDIKAIDNLIIKNHREFNNLQVSLKKSTMAITGFEAMVKNLKHQINEQDAEISALQNRLTKINAAYEEITEQFNDSIALLRDESKTIKSLTNNINTVYYIIGTLKYLKDKGVITGNAGVVGIGRNIQLKSGLDKTAFIKTDLNNINMLPLGARYKKLFTIHPPASYKIRGNDSGDTLYIGNKGSFWSESRYLVIAVK